MANKKHVVEATVHQPRMEGANWQWQVWTCDENRNMGTWKGFFESPKDAWAWIRTQPGGENAFLVNNVPPNAIAKAGPSKPISGPAKRRAPGRARVLSGGGTSGGTRRTSLPGHSTPSAAPRQADPAMAKVKGEANKELQRVKADEKADLDEADKV